MMGGNRTKKKAVGEKTCSRFQFDTFWSDSDLINKPMRAPKNTTTILSGKYWKPVSSIIWIRSMPSAMIHSTKKMAIELLCSCSTALDSSVFPIVLLVSVSLFSASDELSEAVDGDALTTLLSFGPGGIWLVFDGSGLGFARFDGGVALNTGIFGDDDDDDIWTWTASHRTLSIRQPVKNNTVPDMSSWNTKTTLARLILFVFVITLECQHMFRLNRNFPNRILTEIIQFR